MEEREDKLRQADAVSRRLAVGGRHRGLDHRRLTRTLLLGTVAVAAAIYWLTVEYDVQMGELVGFFGASILFVLMLTAVSVAGAFVFCIIKRLSAGSAKRPP